jgi:CRISPR-associated endonuclease/helicase Cas3
VPDHPVAYHPLPCHLLDTAAVTESLWEECLPGSWKDQIAHELGLTLQEAKGWIIFLAGFHDLGKASPGFQTQIHNARSVPIIQSLLTQAGLPAREQQWVPHSLVSALALEDYLKSRQVPREIATTMMMIIGGHHGIFPQAADLHNPSYPQAAIGGGPWKAMRRQLAEWLATTLESSPGQVPLRLPQPAAMSIAGLIAVADWIASSEDEFPFAAQDASNPSIINEATYLKEAKGRAQMALDHLGWSGWRASTVPAAFASLFPGYTPRSLQKTIVEVAPDLTELAIVVIEAPMGDGKTEAAMYLADRWSVSSRGRGIYFALPTQATSEGMFIRVRDFLQQRYPSDRVTLNLMHGHAALSAVFQELQERGRWLLQPGQIYDEERPTDESVGAVIAAEWFAKGKRALLAPFGVGTIDQALLAALPTKHGFVRHLGLAMKTVIIDEVHAYDIYMTTLLERLLDWLGAHGVPVILLSATLPAARRKRLLEAYALGARWPQPATNTAPAPYPRVSWVTAEGMGQRGSSSSSRSTPQLQWLSRTGLDAEDAHTLEPLLQEALREGGCAAVICNSVDRAQKLYEVLRPSFPGPADDGMPLLDLFHARYPFEMRARREQRSLQRFGKGGPRPARAILIATQVIEQSLDLDFDLMITDLAPVDLVLQRMGRLHRHQRQRPAPLSDPRIVVFGPREEGNRVVIGKADSLIYEPHLLLRTWLALSHLAQIALPEDIEELVEDVYADRDCPTDLAPELQSLWQETYKHLIATQQAEADQAKMRYILSPGADVDLDRIMRDTLDEDNPQLHPALQALTRLSEPSVTVICLAGTPEQPRLPTSGELLDMSHPPDFATIRDLLQRSVTLSHRGIVDQMEHEDVPAAWHRTAMLRYSHPIYFDEQGSARVGDQRLRLDDDLGIVFKGKR